MYQLKTFNYAISEHAEQTQYKKYPWDTSNYE